MNLILAFLILSLVIFVHELGHFLVAKAVKAPVYKFAIGMGPILIAKTIGKTEYSIRWIPLGGFVQLEREEDFELNKESEFRKLSIIKRGAVYIAGALFNFILAFILIAGLNFYSGFPSTTIGNISDKSPAKHSDLQIGDLIVSINNKKINSWYDISSIINENPDSELSFNVKRGSKTEIINIKPQFNEELGYYTIGLIPEFEKDFMKSLQKGAELTVSNIETTYKSLIDIFINMFNKKEDSINELSGPVGTIQIITEQTKEGFLSSIALIVSITISLGVFNLLPIPGLDGGKILLLIVEAIRGGKKMTLENETRFTMIGALALLALMVITTWNDIINLF